MASHPRAPGDGEWVLYDQALLAEGSPLPDPLLFAKRTAALMTFSAETEAGAE